MTGPRKRPGYDPRTGTEKRCRSRREAEARAGHRLVACDSAAHILRRVFERFSDRARQVVVLAQEEARTFKHNYIGTEHILLGVLREEKGLGARALQSLDITVERARVRVLEIVG